MASSKIDDNYNKTIIGVSSVDGDTPINVSVNPSTGAMLIEGTSTNDGTFASATNQTTQITLETQLNSLIDTLQELVQRLSPLAGAMDNTARLRVVQTTVPSTAVTGPITSAQSIAQEALGGISYTQRVAQENLTAIQSNINNAVGA